MKGNVLAKSADVAQDVLVANVPVSGVTTVYGTIGCVLDWCWPAALLALTVAAMLRKKRS